MFEPLGRRPGVDCGVFGIPVAQLILNGAQIMSLVRQCVATDVAEHVGMDLAQVGALPDTADQVVDALPRSVMNNQGNRESRIRR